MKITFKKINELDAAVADMFIFKPEMKFSKFAYEYKVFFKKNFKPVFDQYDLALANLRINEALIAPGNQAIIMTGVGRGFEYTKESLRNVIQAEILLKEDWETKEFEVEPIKIDMQGMTFDISYEFLELAKGILI